MIVNDDGDKPVDGNACTDDVCTAGVPSNPILSTGTTCGTNLMCNAQGACVGCITAANCGTDTTCQTHTCSAAGVCGVTNAAVGTLLPAQNQTAGDCKRVQCDGQGQSTTVNDDTDKPVDGNACTKDLCNAGIVVEPARGLGHRVQPEQRNEVQRQRLGARVRAVPAAERLPRHRHRVPPPHLQRDRHVRHQQHGGRHGGPAPDAARLQEEHLHGRRGGGGQ